MLIPGQEEVRPWALGLGLSVPCSGEGGSQGPVGASASQSHQAKEAKQQEESGLDTRKTQLEFLNNCGQACEGPSRKSCDQYFVPNEDFQPMKL